jgi:hypothetical protein
LNNMKKKYIAPQIIDLSIEGMTGIGAGISATSCEIGPHFEDPYCSNGTGFANVCTEGVSASNACTSGTFPYETGVACIPDGTNAASSCASGGVASGVHGSCAGGSSAICACIEGGKPVSICTKNGSTDTAMCASGNNHVTSS